MFDGVDDVCLGEWREVGVERSLLDVADDFPGVFVGFVFDDLRVLFVESVRNGVTFGEDFISEGDGLVWRTVDTREMSSHPLTSSCGYFTNWS